MEVPITRKKIETFPQWRNPWQFFFRQDKTTVRGAYLKKRDGMDNRISEECTTPSFEDGRRVLSMNKNLKLPQSGASPCFFLPDKTKTLFMGCFKRKKAWRTRVSQRRSQPQSLGTVEVFLSIKKIETCPKWRKPLRFDFQTG